MAVSTSIKTNSTLIGRGDDPYSNSTLVITNTILASIVCLITIIGVLGNSFVILLVSLSRQLQTVTNVFVVSLTLSDLIGCGMQSLQAVALLHLKGWPLPEWVCQMTGGVLLIAFKASIVHLALISVDRFMVITRPRNRYMEIYNRRNVFVMVASAWLCPLFFIVLPPALGFGRLGYNAANHFCTFDGNEFQVRIVYVIEEVLFVTTFLIISTCYLKIFIYVKTQHHNLLKLFKNNSGMSMAPEQSEIKMRMIIDKREVEITKNLFIVVCGFFACILPNTLCVLTEKCYLKYFKVTAVVYSINSCINPFIYCFKQPLFRQISLSVFQCRWSEIPKLSPWLQRIITAKRPTDEIMTGEDFPNSSSMTTDRSTSMAATSSASIAQLQ
ncbi:melatonin receptor type 1B-B-like [Diadema antillarum]|uniref:melatonin receptor type 1B-B-like n=1 Tax=Diadema antillarum TaxID=105358 RepID=UPI003A8A4CAC